ncbi:MAG TPA: PP2C family protein-serine/threonine phosphatase [Thermoanaerobaculia bacterium]|nr:PP2C family protein-serine/threonine phosphatase [Thermoanaerobaculia bacterium]
MRSPVARLSVLLISGLALFALLFPRTAPAPGWNSQLSRPRVTAIARAVLQDAGVDVTGCDVWISSEANRDEQRFLRATTDPSGRISPVAVFIIFTNPAKKIVARVRLDWRGRVTALFADDASVKRTGASRPPQDWFPALLKGAQVDGASSEPGPLERTSATKARQAWRMTVPTTPPTPWTLEITASDRGVTEARVQLNLPAEIKRQAEAANKSRLTLGIIARTLSIALWLAAGFFAVQGLVQGRLKLLAVMGGILLMIAPLLLLVGVETPINETLFDPAQAAVDPNPVAAMMAQPATFKLFVLFGVLMGTVLIAVYVAGGLSWSRTLPAKLLALELLLRGKFTTKIVGRAIVNGLALAAWPFVIKQAVVALAGPLVTFEPLMGAASLLSRLPLASAFANRLDTVFVIVFVFAYPLATLYARRAARPLSLLIAFVLMVDNYDRYEPLLLAGMIALGLTIFWDFVYRKFNAATVVTAALFGAILQDIAFLLFQSSAPLQQAGLSAAALLSLIGVGGAWSALRGKDVAMPPGGALPAPTRMERDRIKAEIGVARRMQERMLPPRAPDLAGFDIAAICRPARQIGGDLYDYVPLPADEVGIVVADVCGKGVGAALFMTLTKGLLRAASEEQSDPVAILTEVNGALHGLGNRDVFVTAVLAVVSPRSSRVTLVRAGHNPPLVWRRARAQSVWVQPPGVALSLTREAMFRRVMKVEEIDLDPSDVLLIYSDGVTEAMNHVNEEYGEDRLRTALETSGGQSALSIRDAIVRDLEQFVGKTPASDDLTIVVVRRSEGETAPPATNLLASATDTV